MEIIDNHKCKICNKTYSSYKSLWTHTKNIHKNDKSTNIEFIPPNSTNNIQKLINYNCRYCNKIYDKIKSRWKHEQKCKIIFEEKEQKKQLFEIKIAKINKKKEIKLAIINEKIKLAEINKELELAKIIPINNQLINLIVDKTNIIEELKTKIDENKTNSIIEINNNIQPKQQTLKLNDVIVISRSEDNYINATQLCQAGDKQFNDWFRLNTTKSLLIEAVSETGIPVSQLIDIKKGNSNEFQQGSWIHPDLAIQLAQWISPQFALHVSKWIRTLFTTGNVSIDIQLLEDKNKEIKMKDNKIKLLQDLCIKKQQRKEYPEENVIYILTTEDNKKKRIYIVGKAIKLKNRLSNYNKTSEHEVVYYKSCKSEEDMNVIELMVINKLKEYREKANRDRFILPLEKDITFFTDIIDKSIDFYL
jgi:hypothetical protein